MISVSTVLSHDLLNHMIMLKGWSHLSTKQLV